MNSSGNQTFSASSWVQRSSRSMMQSFSDFSSLVKVVSSSALSDTRRTRSCSRPSIYQTPHTHAHSRMNTHRHVSKSSLPPPHYRHSGKRTSFTFSTSHTADRNMALFPLTDSEGGVVWLLSAKRLFQPLVLFVCLFYESVCTKVT